MTQGTSSMPRHLRWPRLGMLCTKCARMNPISALKITAVMAKMQDCRTTIERALRWALFGPDLKRCQLFECRQVVAAARVNQRLDRRRLREVHEQALGRRPVLAEVPDAVEVRDEWRVAPLRTGRHAVRP